MPPDGDAGTYPLEEVGPRAELTDWERLIFDRPADWTSRAKLSLEARQATRDMARQLYRPSRRPLPKWIRDRLDGGDDLADVLPELRRRTLRNPSQANLEVGLRVLNAVAVTNQQLVKRSLDEGLVDQLVRRRATVLRRDSQRRPRR